MGRFRVHPYLTTSFWLDPRNQYWESNLYTEKAKEDMREWLAEKQKTDRSLANIEQPIKNQNNF